MDEFEFINYIRPISYRQASLEKGVGDDGAVFRSNTSDIVTAVDTFVENIHFSTKTTKAFHVGYRALAANISDMAAMGADPKFFLVSIVIPKEKETRYIQELYKGMYTIAAEFNMDLIGGDTVSGNELTISITVIGTVPKNKARYRSLAREGDIVFVTGTLGDSRAGLQILVDQLSVDDQAYFIKRHQMPEPRVIFSKKLSHLERLALNDVSDGIANELQEIAAASQVDIQIDDALIPTHTSLTQFSKENQWEWKYFGGEDFEIVGTVCEEEWHKVERAAASIQLNVTKIGIVLAKESKAAQVSLKMNRQICPLPKKGYIHLK